MSGNTSNCWRIATDTLRGSWDATFSKRRNPYLKNKWDTSIGGRTSRLSRYIIQTLYAASLLVDADFTRQHRFRIHQGSRTQDISRRPSSCSQQFIMNLLPFLVLNGSSVISGILFFKFIHFNSHVIPLPIMRELLLKIVVEKALWVFSHVLTNWVHKDVLSHLNFWEMDVKN